MLHPVKTSRGFGSNASLVQRYIRILGTSGMHRAAHRCEAMWAGLLQLPRWPVADAGSRSLSGVCHAQGKPDAVAGAAAAAATTAMQLTAVTFRVSPPADVPPSTVRHYILVLGGSPDDSDWDLTDSVTMTRSAAAAAAAGGAGVAASGSSWSATVELPPGIHHFKLLREQLDGSLDWEAGATSAGGGRSVDVPESAQALDVTCDWDNMDATRTFVTAARKQPLAAPPVAAAAAAASSPAEAPAQRVAEAAAAAPAACAFVAAAKILPHVEKVAKGGEDAFFICTRGLGALGVSDGVSGWADEGVDPAQYARTLAFNAATLASDTACTADARDVIAYAHEKTAVPGSATLCVAMMKPGRTLQVANLGDSGVKVLRGGKVVFQTEPLQHEFNMPLQLSSDEFTDYSDRAEQARVEEFRVEADDVIVAASDGLWDNVFDEQMLQLAAATIPAGGAATQEAAARLAAALSETAHQNAVNTRVRTPWTEQLVEHGPFWYRIAPPLGGKMDDCTVVVAVVL